MPLSPPRRATSQPSVLYHFSEEASIARFEPRGSDTASDDAPAVWAIDEVHAPLYWFPRDCPRGTVWARDDSEQARLASIFGTDAWRLHVTELGWLDRIRDCELVRYDLDAASFSPWPQAYGYYTSPDVIVPRAQERVGDLLAQHVEAGIEIRFVPNLWRFWDTVVASELPFSGVRLAHATPRA